MWQCPLCQQPLQLTEKFWHCENNHTFDKAKSGYMNLLPVQSKNSKQPGDDKLMLAARREFHSTGGYAPLMAELAEQIRKETSHKAAISLFEAGCGEGAYIRYLRRALSTEFSSLTTAANDIAKVGVERAAKADKESQYIVASSYHLPVLSESVDIVLEVFAPGSHTEYARILAPDGKLITVDPGPEHLFELKQHIYENPQKHDSSVNESVAFTMTSQAQVCFSVDLQEDRRRSGLLGMTPLYWKLQPEKRERLSATLKQVTADFVIRTWCKTS
ncbi:methyltransferase domain-containing protein [Salinimonas sp. HHU 13199]|uniref:Methyltransferase domain-containing protein n=1 Tax=Salinimonas profundi TaxID=2729140 RepID=A0ABR8LE25_9ALTE|nr:methyltransferase domain-containing protein [Salinimonas profundi]MBD3584553.1 methyltransferase domain-containing protein [Salinimonas profundi]